VCEWDPFCPFVGYLLFLVVRAVSSWATWEVILSAVHSIATNVRVHLFVSWWLDLQFRMKRSRRNVAAFSIFTSVLSAAWMIPTIRSEARGSQFISQECSGMSPRKRTVQVNEVTLLCDSGQGSTYEYEDRGVCLSGDTAKAVITCTCRKFVSWRSARRLGHEMELCLSRFWRSLDPC
jgi:hypothetical protein